MLSIGQLPLSLSDAIKIGLRNNYEIQIADLRSEVSKKNELTGPPGKLPAANFRLDQANKFSFDSSPTSFVDGAFSENELSAMVDASWTLFDGHKVRINKTRLRQLTERSEAFAQLAVENTVQGIMLAYYEVLVEQEKLEALNDVRELSEEKVKWAQTMHRSGAISDYNLLNYQNALLKDSIDLEYQKIKHKRSMRQLKSVLNTDNRKEFRLTGKLRPSKKTFSYPKMKGRLIHHNKDLKNQYINSVLLDNQLAMIKADRNPEISVRSGVAHEISTSKFRNEERTQGRVFDYYVNFSLSYRLSGKKELNNRIQVAEIEKRIASINKAEIKRKLSQQLLAACEQHQEQQNIFGIQQKLISNLKKGLEIQKQRLDSGYSQFLEFRSLQMDFLQSQLKAAEMIYDLQVAEIEILKLTGGLSKHQR